MRADTVTTQQGYLVLADISGYTSYLAGVELDHAHEILSDLLETIVASFKPLLIFSKLEGDAVFAYAPEANAPRGDVLLDLLDSTYAAFRDRQVSMHHRTTCECNACRNIAALDLKFFTHYGDYIVQAVAGIAEVIGSDVNLVHRLMKNKVSEVTGWRGYALFTAKALDRLGARPDGLHGQTEAYDHLGEVQTYSLDLHQPYQARVGARRVFIAPEAAHEQIALDFTAPREVVWEWFNDPQKRGRWMHSELKSILRPGGRAGVGARNHCVHGKNEIVVEDVLDTKLFDYYTVRHTPQGLPASLLITFHFTSLPGGGASLAPARPGPTPTVGPGGTHVCLTFLFEAQVKWLPNWLLRQLCKSVVKNNIQRQWSLDRIDSLITSDSTG